MSALAQDLAADTWWPHLVDLLRKVHPELVSEDWDETPSVLFWRCISPPRAYEAASRRRVRVSDVAATIATSYGKGPAEGGSKTDGS